LKDGIAAVLRGPSWQSCRTHFVRNLIIKAPKTAHGIVATSNCSRASVTR